MSSDKKDFYGKEVTDAIKQACETLGEAQENIDIEVVETGSTGIFGLIRKKAHIRAVVKPVLENTEDDLMDPGVLPERQDVDGPVAPPPEEAASVHVPEEPAEKDVEPVDMDQSDDEPEPEPKDLELSPESIETIKTELLQLVELMGFPSTVTLEVEGNSVNCVLGGEFEENLTGPDGKVLDSLQYILRKIVSRKVQERVRIAVDAGDYRMKRLENLKEKAVELATMVKEDGKTQVVPALNPSERREIHMVLQEDKEIRSRSVGEGLFKKILIYKPGKGGKPGPRKRTRSKSKPRKPGKPRRQRDS